jgi:hypothetical protein
MDADTYNLIGGDTRLNYKDLSLASGYIRGNNVQNVQFYGPPYEDNHIWFGEAQYFLYPWLVPYLRYENLSVQNVNHEDQARFIVGLAILIRANIKLNVEGKFFSNNQPAKLVEGNEMADDQFAFQLDWAF